MAKLRIAQIGMGHGHAAGKWHSLTTNPNVEAVLVDSVADIGGFDAVAVETRNHQSLPIALAVVEAGKHLWLDKPAGDDFPMFERLLDEAERQRLHVQLGYMFRYSPGFMRIAELAHSGALGKVFAVRAHMSTWIDLKERTEQSRHQGGILYDLGAHMFDQIVYLLGRPTHVTSVQRNETTPELPTYRDNTLAVLEFDGAIATLEIAAMEPRPMARRFEVFGTEQSVILEPFDPAIRLFLTGALTELPEVSRQSLYDRELEAFVGVLRGDCAPDRTREHERLVQETLLRATGVLAA